VDIISARKSAKHAKKKILLLNYKKYLCAFASLRENFLLSGWRRIAVRFEKSA
jgi:hypothetical protein